MIASYVFYGAWDWRFLSLIVISTFVDYLCGARISRSANPGVRKTYLFVSIATNLGILGFFKYYDFFAEGFSELLSLFGLSATHATLDIVLPVGISFYTFQTMSYTIDIYRKKMPPCAGFLDFALFVSFFPQLVAGPIERASRLIPQIEKKRIVSFRHLSHGSYLIIWGLFKKVVIADNLGLLVDEIFGKSSGFSGSEVVIAVLFFSFQIYCDFSGYSDIARGIARLMGFDLMVNFNLPYFSRNPSDFWRRWHISLSTWLKDYLYVSLGGNRNGSLKTYRNLMLTMLLGGLWHGAAWNFVFWGFYHGALLAIHRVFRDFNILNSERVRESNPRQVLIKYLSIFIMFGFTLYGWLLFRAESFEQISNMTIAIFSFRPDPFFIHNLAKLIFYAWPLFLVQLLQYFSDDLRIFLRMKVPLQAAAYCILIFLFIVLGNYDGTSFIYFQF
ncbi:MAG TPA: MBOAT family O-acyltransferase [Pseudomonadales bacterium]